MKIRLPLVLLVLCALFTAGAAAGDAEISLRLPDVILSGQPFTLAGTAKCDKGIERIVVRADGREVAAKAAGGASAVALEELALPVSFDGAGRHNIQVSVYAPGEKSATLVKTFVVTVRGSLGDPPAVRLSAPKEIAERTAFLLEGTATDDSGIEHIFVYLDGRAIAHRSIEKARSVDLGALQISITLPKPGTFRLLVRACDSPSEGDGHFTDREIDIKAVSLAGDPPKVTLAIPREVVAGSELPVTGLATDAGGIRRIELFLDGAKVGEAELAGQPSIRLESIPWKMTAPESGSHVIMVRAYDDLTSGTAHCGEASVTVKVRKGRKILPAVTLRLPAKIVAGEPFTVDGALAFDGGLTSVEVFYEGARIATRELAGDSQVSLGALAITVTPDSAGRRSLLVRAHAPGKGAETLTGEKSVTLNVAEAPSSSPPGIRLSAPAKVPARTSFTLEGTIHDEEGIDKITLSVNGKKVTERDGLGKKDLDIGNLRLDVTLATPGDYEIVLRSHRKFGRSSAPWLEEKVKVRALPNWGKVPWMIVYPPKKIYSGESFTITGKATDDTGIISVVVYLDGAEAARSNLDYVKELNFEEQSLALRIPTPGSHRLRVRVLDNVGAGGDHGSEVAFTILVENPFGAVPKVKVDAPSTVRAGRTFTVGGAVTDDTGVNRILVFIDGHLVFDREVGNVKELRLDDLKIVLNAPPQGDHLMKVRACDEYPSRTDHYTDVEKRFKVIE